MEKNGMDVGGAPGRGGATSEARRKIVGVQPAWRIAAIVLSLACLILAVALIVVATRPGDAVQPPASAPAGSTDPYPAVTPRPPWSDVYGGMTAEDYDAVRDFLFGQKNLRLTRVANATLDSNYIFLIEDYLPAKLEVLEFQRRGGGGAKPTRRAKVVLFMGEENPKAVREYLVHPVDRPATIEPYSSSAERSVAWTSRPICLNVEAKLLDAYLRHELRVVAQLMNESFGQWYDDSCGSKCIFYNLAPRTGGGGERYVYAWFYLNFNELRGYYLHPVSFYVIIEVPPRGANFSVKYVYYNDVRFDSLSNLLRDYRQGKVDKLSYPAVARYVNSYGSPARRGVDPNPTDRRPPQHFYPDGRRFSVNDNHVYYMGWTFDLYFRSVSGVELFNVKHKGESVAYEISMQDILAAYSGAEPENFFKAYFDNGWSLGTRSHPLVKDVDCPPGAVYLDSLLYSVGNDTSVRMKDTTCVFEYRNSIPLRRHISEDFYNGGFNFVFSMPDSVLVVRQVITLWNYDYVFDYEFHQNGVIEIKVSSTGYVAATVNRRPEFGNLIDRGVGAGANIHVHLFNFKFDLDVSDGPNRFMTVDLLRDNSTTNPLSSGGGQWQQTRIAETLKMREGDAAMQYNFNTPKYLVVFNPNRTNALGYKKGYRIQSGSFLKMLLPDDSAVMTGASWAKNQVCVTKTKDTERGTASIYTQGHPERPVVDFSSFYEDNENIVDEDLVAWVTVGMLHVPTAEDVPVTTTPGKTLSVVLAPFSFFDEDPSISSKDAFLLQRR